MANGKLAAAGVHILTASGILAGFAAFLAAIDHNWKLAFVWLALATVIDGIDGPLARRFDVKTHLPRFSGERLDLIIDYFTYVIVPAFMIYDSGLLPPGAALPAAGIVLMTSLFHFCDVESKTEDGYFVGFPALWNGVALYLFIFALPPAAAFIIIAALAALTFVPLKWVHPVRVRRLRGLTFAMLAIWSIAVASALWSGFPAPPLLQTVIAICSLYLLAIGLARSLKGAAPSG